MSARYLCNALEKQDLVVQNNPSQYKNNKLSKLTFVLIVIADFFYWTLNPSGDFQIGNLSLTYILYAILILLFFLVGIVNYNKIILAVMSIFFLYVFLEGGPNELKNLATLFIILLLASSLKKICFDESFVNIMVSIVFVEIFANYFFGLEASNVYSDFLFYKGLAGSYKLLMYSFLAPLFLLGLCLVATNRSYMQAIICMGFAFIFYFIFKSYARFGLVYILMWSFFLFSIFSRGHILLVLGVGVFVFATSFFIMDTALIDFLLSKGSSGRADIFDEGIAARLVDALTFLFGMPGSSGLVAKVDELLIPDLGSLFVAFYDYGLIGFVFLIFVVARFFILNINRDANLKIPVLIYVSISVFDFTGNQLFSFSVPSVVIIWAALLNNPCFAITSNESS